MEDKVLLDKLYACMFSEDPWVRMRAADTFEKVCREHPDWIEPYIDRLQTELSTTSQPSILWHLAQIYPQVQLTTDQKQFALAWLTKLLSTSDADWIVAANAMQALAYFTQKGDYLTDDLIRLLTIQRSHKSKAVVKKANKLIDARINSWQKSKPKSPTQA